MNPILWTRRKQNENGQPDVCRVSYYPQTLVRAICLRTRGFPPAPHTDRDRSRHCNQFRGLMHSRFLIFPIRCANCRANCAFVEKKEESQMASTPLSLYMTPDIGPSRKSCLFISHLLVLSREIAVYILNELPSVLLCFPERLRISFQHITTRSHSAPSEQSIKDLKSVFW